MSQNGPGVGFQRVVSLVSFKAPIGYLAILFIAIESLCHSCGTKKKNQETLKLIYWLRTNVTGASKVEVSSATSKYIFD